MHDPISDFLNKLKIASRTGKESFGFSYSGMIASIAETLSKKGYILSWKKSKKGHEMEIVLPGKETSEGKRVAGVKRVSKLSKRMYRKAREIRPVRNGSGIAVLSTPQGVLSDMDAKKAKVGGEVLFEIW